MKTITEWLSQWLLDQCDGDWEHENGVSITTLDNPGFQIEIDIKDARIAALNIRTGTVENSENDWYSYKIVDGRFIAAGDPLKLEFLLQTFKQIIEGDIKSSV